MANADRKNVYRLLVFLYMRVSRSTDSIPYMRKPSIFRGIAISLFWLVIGYRIEIDVAVLNWVPLLQNCLIPPARCANTKDG